MSSLEIVLKNLEKMLSEDEGGMLRLLCRESIGGNAGKLDKYPCAGANFFYKQNTGEIITFTNSVEEYDDSNSGTFRVAVNVIYSNIPDKINGMYKILSVICPSASEEAEEVLKKTAELYNKSFGQGFVYKEIIIQEKD